MPRRVRFAAASAALLLACAIAGPGAVEASSLPEGRAYEMVSPPGKQGGDVAAESQRSRASADGNAVGFMTLTAFGDPQGTGTATEYIAERSLAQAPGTSGWRTHAITPLQEAVPFPALFGSLEPRYEGDFSADLSIGIFNAWSPLTADSAVADTVNLYRRTDLRTAGAGSYQLITACPLCNSLSTTLPPLARTSVAKMRSYLAWTSKNLEHVIFESRVNLTSDAPAYATGCDPAAMTDRCRPRLYEWDNGVVRLAGILPDGTAADVSFAGQSAGSRGVNIRIRTPHTISDGSDGHFRVFFTQPTNASGATSSEVPLANQNQVNSQPGGKLFVRVDNTATYHLNASERSSPDAFRPARFLDASYDGRRAFFMTQQALTNDAPADGSAKLYMYDAGKPDAAPDNLTFLNPDNEPGGGLDGGNAQGLIGTSAGGHVAYMIVSGQLLPGQPILGNAPGIYRWADGDITYIGPAPQGGAQDEILSTGANIVLTPTQARVAPDGDHLLFSAIDGEGLTGYDHGSCISGLGSTCRELYVYSAKSDTVRCVSCHPRGTPATVSATVSVRRNNGGAQVGSHLNHALSDDGAHVFFSTGEALVVDDVNGRSDAYQFDVATGELHLLSSGTDPSDSWFVDASPDGRDAFFVTRERLVGWDVDSAYDLYDARIGGGFPEPAPAPPICTGDDCQGAATGHAEQATIGSSALKGSGNLTAHLRPRAKRCRKGSVKKTVRGRRKCVRRKKRRPATHARHIHAERRGS